MDSILLNRIGIVMNFLAGFLLAPELLGSERLRKLEFFCEILLVRITTFSNQTRSGVGDFLDDLSPHADHHYALSKVLHKAFAVAAILFWLACPMFIVVDKINISEQIKFTIAFSLIAPFMIIGSLIVLIFYLSLFLMIFITCIIYIFKSFLNKLQGEERLRSIFVWWGIIIFILGNLFQILATF